MWTYGYKKDAHASCTLEILPIVLLPVLPDVRGILARICSLEQESVPVVFDTVGAVNHVVSDDRRGTYARASFVPADCEACNLNENTKYESNGTFYEDYRKEFIGYVVVQRIDSLARRPVFINAA